MTGEWGGQDGDGPIDRISALTLEGGKELRLLSEEGLEGALDLLDGLCGKGTMRLVRVAAS